MADTVRTTVYLDSDAAQLLTERASERKRGEYLSGLLRRDKGPLQPGQGVSERIEEKLDKLIELLDRA